MSEKMLDVLCVGHALLDILTHVEDDFLVNHEIKKSAMTLVDAERSNYLYNLVPQAVEISGGSAANTAVGVASLGGSSAFIGKVNDDPFGKIYIHDLRAAGVVFDTPPLKSQESATGTSLILITPDAERSMQTHFGACVHFDIKDLDEGKIQDARIFYLEGYMWDTPSGRAMLKKAAELCRKHKTKVAFTLSDPWLVDRHRADFTTFVKEEVDILFANDQELTSLFKTTTAQDAVNIVDSIVPFAAVTFGPEGSIICDRGQQTRVDAYAVPVVADTTGAGDLYAAGVLYGLSRGLSPRTCGMLGSLAAAEIISHIGPRPQQRLSELARQALAA